MMRCTQTRRQILQSLHTTGRLLSDLQKHLKLKLSTLDNLFDQFMASHDAKNSEALYHDKCRLQLKELELLKEVKQLCMLYSGIGAEVRNRVRCSLRKVTALPDTTTCFVECTMRCPEWHASC